MLQRNTGHRALTTGHHPRRPRKSYPVQSGAAEAQLASAFLRHSLFGPGDAGLRFKIDAVERDEFQALEETFQTEGSEAVFDRLIRRARGEKDHRLLFAVRLMACRHRLGLPLLETEPVVDVGSEQRPAYEAAFREAVREAGELCLAGGDIVGAWPYFQAIGEREAMAAAIETVSGGDHLDRVIEIAYQEGVNPRKGFELILEHHGVCRAISWFPSNRDYGSRQACLRLLVRTLYGELARNLKETIAATEGASPETDGVAQLIAGRAWLFEGSSYYVDSTHLASVLGFAPELQDRESLRMAWEMANYGDHLAPMFHFRGDPPFEDIYLDHAVYLKALLNEEVDVAIGHFRRKAAEAGDSTAAEVLIDLLVRLNRYPEAIAASMEYFPDVNAAPRGCPSAAQLCQLAGDYATLRNVARQRGDLLGFAAGVIQS